MANSQTIEKTPIGNLIKNDPNLKFFKEGDMIKGVLLKQEGTTVYVDLGIYGTGIIFGKEFYDASGLLKNMKESDEITAKVISTENDDGYIELSLKEANQNLFWDDLKAKMDSKEIITIKIAEINKGGLIAHFSGTPAFLPVSQLSMANYPRVEGGSKEKILQELERHLGKEFRVRIIDLDPKEKKIILSEKEAQIEHISEILDYCKVGDVVEGTITGIADFGAFVKFTVKTESGEHEFEGLIHISELSWELIDNPHDFIKVGNTVKAKIISTHSGRVSLSLKALVDDPWKDADKNFERGQIVEGTVFKFNPFGAFVKLQSGIHGLCHVSDFENIDKMKDHLKIGKTYTFKISSIAAQVHKLGLSWTGNAEKKGEQTRSEQQPKEPEQGSAKTASAEEKPAETPKE